MPRKRDGFVPLGDVAGAVELAGDRAMARRVDTPQARRHFTRLDQITQLVDVSEADAELGYMARLLALCSLPRTNPGNRLQYVRRNGPYTLAMTATGTAKLPYGPLPRLLLAWVTTEAVRTQSPVLVLEDSLSAFMRKLGLESSGGAGRLRLRHDHGSNYLADDFQQEIAFFGIESSPSFVREPEGNGVAERFIRTLKENLLWVRSFETIEELRLALLAFKRTYNEQWMLEKYDYRSPARVRRDLGGLDAAA